MHGLGASGRLLLAVALLGPWACSGDDELKDENQDGVADGVVSPNNVAVVTPTRPTGYVAGRVQAAATGGALSGATVSIFGGGIAGQVMTGSDGGFQFGPIAAGAGFGLDVTLAGHVTASVQGLSIDDESGNFPSSNGAIFVGPIGLLASTGELEVLVLSSGGLPIANSQVSVETSVAFVDRGEPRGSVVVEATTDVEGSAMFSGLPDLWSLPPSEEDAAGIFLHVDPVDSDGNGEADLSGASLFVSGAELRSRATPLLVVLSPSGDAALHAVASNVPALVEGAPQGPAVLGVEDDLRVVFDAPIDRDTLVVDLRDESGTNEIPVSIVVSAFDNVLTIDPDAPLDSGAEYNLALATRARGSASQQVLNLSAPFFTAMNPGESIVVAGRFIDANRDGQWGTANDRFSLSVSAPVGRSLAVPAFRVELYVDLDLNGTSTVGDGPGELPGAGAPYPAPLIVDAAEPAPGNGAPLSGFTTFLAPVAVNLSVPRAQTSGAVDYEVRFSAVQNGQSLVASPDGVLAPRTFSGSANLVAQ